MKKITYVDFVNRCRKRHGDRYKYVEKSFTKLSNKTTIICPMHGEFSQNAKNHTNGDGCPKCGGVHRRTQEEFLTECILVHDDIYDYSKTIFTSNRTKVAITCYKHGEFNQIAGDHIIGKGCPKCGVGAISQNEFIDQCISVHGHIYDYSKAVYHNKHTDLTIICSTHGEFNQSPHNHLAGKGCSLCNGGVNLNTEQFIKNAKSVHGDLYDYSLTEYVNARTDVTIICPTHGTYNKSPLLHYNHKIGCPSCGNTGSSNCEKNLLDQIDDGSLIRNSRKIITPKELDGYFPNQKIAIEYCGLYWHSELRGKTRNYHRDKRIMCELQGIKLITVFEDEWLNNPDVVISRIKHALHTSSTISIPARKCTVREINLVTARDFLNQYHLQGYTGCRYRYGIFHNDELLSVMTFSVPNRAKGVITRTDHTYEISRFASAINVIGGGSKLLKAFERNHTPTEIYTYADLRWGSGDSYLKMGFTHIHDSKPNYWYFKQANKRYHRFAYRKNTSDDQTITEWENRQLQGWNRIWDCGHRKFVKLFS